MNSSGPRSTQPPYDDLNPWEATDQDQDYLEVPKKIWLDGDRLVWDWGETKARTPEIWQDGDRLVSDSGEPTPRRINREVFDKFIRLSRNLPRRLASPKEILTIAEAWGPLGTCDHGYANPHPTGDRAHQCNHNWERAGTGSESLSHWHGYSAIFRLLRDHAALLHRGRLAGCDAWHQVATIEDSLIPNLPRPVDPFPSELDDGMNRVLRIERENLIHFVNEILWVSGAQPAVRWQGRSIVRTVSSPSLLGALATQLVDAIGRTTGYVDCSACGKPYKPDRKPRDGQNHFCESCGGKAADRLRHWRRRHEPKDVE